MEIKINTANAADNKGTKAETTAIDHSKDILVDNETSFSELIRILSTKPETAEAAENEAECKAQEAKEEKLREIYGEDYDAVFSGSANGELEKMKRRPGVRQLRTGFPRIAMIKMDKGSCEVFINGYAVYDNGNRRTVLWAPDCGSCTYYFTKLKDSEKSHMSEKSEVGEDILGEYPWYNAIIIAGENRIEYNLEHPKSVSSTSDFDEDSDTTPAFRWIGSAHIDTPEEAYMKKEAREERHRALTDKQRKVYDLYYGQGLSQREIAKMIGVDRTTVREHLKAIQGTFKSEREKFF